MVRGRAFSWYPHFNFFHCFFNNGGWEARSQIPLTEELLWLEYTRPCPRRCAIASRTDGKLYSFRTADKYGLKSEFVPHIHP